MWRWEKSDQVNHSDVITPLLGNGHHPRSDLVLDLPKRKRHTWRPPVAWRWGRIVAVVFVGLAVGLAVAWLVERNAEHLIGAGGTAVTAAAGFVVERGDA